MQQPLTPKQAKLYAIIKQFNEEYQRSPTIRELCNRMETKWPNAVYELLNALETKGYIVRRKNAKRNIDLRNTDSFGLSTQTVLIPVRASVGCDNLNIVADERYDETIEIDRSIIAGKGDIAAVRAVGNSMNDANINEGDYILIQLTQDANVGDRIVAIIGDMVTVKKLDRKDGFVILRPESTDPKYKPIILNENFKIAGKVIGVISNPAAVVTEVVPDKFTNNNSNL